MSRIDIVITENPHYDSAMAFVENITEKVDGVFSWTIEAFGGFATAHFEMVVPEADAWAMLNRIGKRVAFLSPDAPDKSLVCWEGMIHTVNIDDGGATIARSLENCYNRIRVNYTPVDTNHTPPIVNSIFGSDDNTDATSAALYGKREMRYITGEISGTSSAIRLAKAGQMRDLFLSQFANPRASTTTMRRGGGASASSLRVAVDCIGFSHELAYKFHEETTNSTVTLDAILTAIITNTRYDGGDGEYHGLDFVSTDTTGITANTNTQTRYNLTEKTTRTYIDELMRMGDGATARRTFFGYYENRKFFYTVEPTAYEYITRRNDPEEAIYDRTTGAVVPPWLVRPAKAIRVPDLLPDETVASEILNTAGTFLIGTVEFTAPATVILTPIAPDPSGMWGTAQLYRQGYT